MESSDSYMLQLALPEDEGAAALSYADAVRQYTYNTPKGADLMTQAHRIKISARLLKSAGREIPTLGEEFQKSVRELEQKTQSLFDSLNGASSGPVVAETSELGEENQKLKKEIGKLEKASKLYTDANRNLRATISELEGTVESQKNRIAELVSEVTAVTGERQKAVEARRVVVEELSEANKAMKSASDSFEKQKESYEEEIRILKAEVERVKAQMANLEKEYEELEARVEGKDSSEEDSDASEEEGDDDDPAAAEAEEKMRELEKQRQEERERQRKEEEAAVQAAEQRRRAEEDRIRREAEERAVKEADERAAKEAADKAAKEAEEKRRREEESENSANVIGEAKIDNTFTRITREIPPGTPQLTPDDATIKILLPDKNLQVYGPLLYWTIGSRAKKLANGVFNVGNDTLKTRAFWFGKMREEDFIEKWMAAFPNLQDFYDTVILTASTEMFKRDFNALLDGISARKAALGKYDTRKTRVLIPELTDDDEPAKTGNYYDGGDIFQVIDLLLQSLTRIRKLLFFLIERRAAIKTVPTSMPNAWSSVMKQFIMAISCDMELVLQMVDKDFDFEVYDSTWDAVFSPDRKDSDKFLSTKGVNTAWNTFVVKAPFQFGGIELHDPSLGDGIIGEEFSIDTDSSQLEIEAIGTEISINDEIEKLTWDQ